ncbi:TetR/AcrR family transcriptional regulator [Microbacterium sp. 18062]|uniref:TetR/AcrR family transcriptional regulator n=1 Tax=Microbacterium sp. 18062 TaxID=2681410 RepID=UPI001358FDE5|nr:TetR/AcrR family transcriptional regulator [Microbacterium sp. 18062]
MAARRNYAKGTARRQQIVAKAFTAFSTQGFRGASILQIAADCGVSRAGLLHHFPTKEDLLRAVLEERDRQDTERFLADLGGDPPDGLVYFRQIARIIEHNAAHPGLVSLFAVLSAEATEPGHPAFEYFTRRYDLTRSRMSAALRDLAGQGALRPGIDPGQAAVDLVALIDGLQVQWLYSPAEIDMVAHYRRRIDEILTVPLY